MTHTDTHRPTDKQHRWHSFVPVGDHVAPSFCGSIQGSHMFPGFNLSECVRAMLVLTHRHSGRLLPKHWRQELLNCLLCPEAFSTLSESRRSRSLECRTQEPSCAVAFPREQVSTSVAEECQHTNESGTDVIPWRVHRRRLQQRKGSVALVDSTRRLRCMVIN